MSDAIRARTKYNGSCHCGEVKFEVYAAKHLTVLDCNCSVCTKKQNKHCIVPAKDFKLIQGHTVLTTYSFGTHKARHMFCSKCGVQSFYIPRSNPECYAIMPHCIDSPQPEKFTYSKFDGQNWEKAMEDRSKSK